MDKDKKPNKSDTHEKTKIEQVFHWKFVVVLALLILVVVSLVVYRQNSQRQPQTKKITVNKQVLQKRSKDLALIRRGLTGKAVDVNTGKIVKAARIFSADDKTVYLQVDFNTAPKGTIVDYIRYKDGRYVDHGEVILARADIEHVLFDWTINKLLAASRNGKWKVATYTNGILAKRVLYEITGNKISYVYPDQPVNPTDSDYSLSKVLGAQVKLQNPHE